MSRPTILAPALTDESVIGVVSPSSPAGIGMVPCTIDYWRASGHRVEVGEHLDASLGGYLAGTAEQRAADLNHLLRGDDVDLIVPAMGGKGASHLLPLLDYDAFARRPKLFMGLSDASLLALVLHERTGVITFHGPIGMHFSALPPYSERAMIAALTAMEPLGRLEAFGHWQTLRGAGPVQGRLLGGHLGTIRVLLGTPFAPDWDGAVLFIEEIDCELHDVDAALTHFRLAGVLDRIAALVVGRCVNVAERWRPSVETVHDVVLRCCEGTDFPILADVDLGHTDERLTLPIGALATVYPAESAISVDEAVVACPL